MRRADRLFRIIQRLRQRGVHTARALAEELEVSERTVYRNVRDLILSGVPILGEAGVGYALPRGFDLPPLMFTEEEIEALVLGARVVQSTFGVVLDTSGSMERTVLARALGTIASYATSRDVPAVRVVFCDAAPYDEGYLRPEEIAGRVRGRSGTILQPGIDLLQRAPDFPADGPLLIITDGYCDRLQVKREHAFLVPRGRSLPFVAKGPVFRIS